MPKTIKFNLNCDGTSVRTIEDLREHFCIQEVLDYYKKGILARWLKVHDYNAELEKLEKISSEDDEKVISGIVQILDVEQDEKSIRESLALLKFQKECETFYSKISKGIKAEQDFLDSYKSRYDEVVEQIIQNKNDYSVIKSATKNLADNFMWVIKIDFERLFYYLYEKAPMALFAFSANEKMRDFYIPKERVSQDSGSIIRDVDIEYEDEKDKFYYKCKKNLYEKMKGLITEAKLKEILGVSLRVNNENTNDFWRDLESENKKFLILLMKGKDSYYSPTCLVRSSGKLGEELGEKNINDKFVIINGIDFKNNRNDILYYMEV